MFLLINFSLLLPASPPKSPKATPSPTGDRRHPVTIHVASGPETETAYNRSPGFGDRFSLTLFLSPTLFFSSFPIFIAASQHLLPRDVPLAGFEDRFSLTLFLSPTLFFSSFPIFTAARQHLLPRDVSRPGGQ